MGRPRVTAPDLPLPGRRPRDGSRMLARLWREGRIDWRTAPAKALMQVTGLLADDWHGVELPGAARLLLDRTAAIVVAIMLRERRLLAFAADGKAEQPGDKYTIALSNALRRNLEVLDSMRLRAGATQPRTLATCSTCSGGFYDLSSYVTHRGSCHAAADPDPAQAPTAPPAEPTLAPAGDGTGA